ncbi:methyltransferase domain-containing protein [Clostridium estertheticum]|uniref:class I SAM-dependent methyltransferase n=1 Tax=Clostridium estertheticum TaxID=238834 RepID=UPI0013EEDA6D|nr:class I SAM-dependent methyltransferase [Clostridium estertheticum]MBZ9609906.1 methyltransferase domain-containing protein [Clostridium estertheticum]
MDKQSSYQIDKIACNTEKEINRLKGQVNLFWDNEIKHYTEFGLRDGMTVVELGSGPGFVTEKILNKFPGVNITDIEIDPVLVDYAKKHLSHKGLNRYQVIQKSIMETGLLENTFDFAITRLLLEHLPDPVNAVREVFRILKPGGIAVFIDNDFEMHIMTCPHIPELRELYEAYCQSRYLEGGNPKIGRELPTILKKGGFSNIHFEIINAHNEILGEDLFLKSEGIGIPFKLVQDGFLTSKALGKISIGWRNMLKCESHSITRQLYMAAGEKIL